MQYRNVWGQLHREDGPAIEHPDGTKVWFLNGLRHREDGPAIEWANGSREWHLNGQRHRVDGPAYEDLVGNRYWYLRGDNITIKVETWIKEHHITVPFDKDTQVLFLLRFL
jgi:hypothetical protein